VSATDLVFVLRSGQADDSAEAEDQDQSAVLRIQVPNVLGRLERFELLASDLSTPDQILATFCESAGYDAHYCARDLLKHAQADMDRACTTLGLPFFRPQNFVGSRGFADDDLGPLGPRRFIVGFAWRLPTADVRRFVMSAVRAFRPNTRTSLVLICLPADMQKLHQLAGELGPLTSGVGAEVNLHIFPCVGRKRAKEVGFIAFFRYRCLTKVLSLSDNMVGSVLEVDPHDLVLLSDIRDVRSGMFASAAMLLRWLRALCPQVQCRPCV
jgi:hypothetical protein